MSTSILLTFWGCARAHSGLRATGAKARRELEIGEPVGNNEPRQRPPRGRAGTDGTDTGAIKMEMPGKNFKEGFVEADGFRIRYMEAGRGPALVMLPGSAGLELSIAADLRKISEWWPSIRRDGEHRRTIRARNRFASSWLPWQRRPRPWASRNTISWAPRWAARRRWWVAALYPERVSSLILEGSMSFRRGHWTP